MNNSFGEFFILSTYLCRKSVNLGFFAVHKIVSKYAGKNLCVHRKDAKRHKTEDISVNNGSP